MNLAERENYRPEDAYFQDNEPQYEVDSIDAPPADHSVSDNAEPDYGNDFTNQKKLNENPDGDEFDNDLDDEDEDERNDDEFDNEDPGDDDDDLQDDDFNKESREDEEYTDPSRQL